MSDNSASEPYIHLSIDDGDEKITKSLFDALDSNKWNVPHPQQMQWTELKQVYLANLKFKSSVLLHKSCVLCHVAEKGQELHFVPTYNHIAKKYFTELNSKPVIVSRNDTDKNIVTALNQALQSCEPELE